MTQSFFCHCKPACLQTNIEVFRSALKKFFFLPFISKLLLIYLVKFVIDKLIKNIKGEIMDTIDAIINRRSIRQYTDQNISEDNINTILRSAMYAPSAMNYQPWHFIVINKKEVISELQNIFPHADMLKQATLLIIVCGDTELERSTDYIVQDCAAATQNALLAVHSLGLGAVWLSVYPNKDVIAGLKKKFNLPDNILPVSTISIVFPAEVIEKEERFHINRVHTNTW